jgi:hypothetical protein
MCPKGDDPVTVGQYDRSIQIELKSLDGGSMRGAVRFTFELFTTSIGIGSNVTE